MIIWGAAVNSAAVIAGSLIGLFAGKLLSERLQKSIMYALALVVAGVAVSGFNDSEKALVPIISMVVGTVIGELLDLDSAINRLGEKVKERVGGKGRFTEGFVNGTLVFVVGAMSIMGGLNSGLQNDHTLLYFKSVLDGVSALVFASTMGIGVIFAAIPVFVLEGGVALLAAFLAPYLDTAVIGEINYVGSLMILAISLNMLGAAKVKVLNMVPAILMPIFLCRIL